MKDALFEEMHEVEDRHWWFVARRQIIGGVVEKICPDKNCRIFDVGCGNGDNLALLAGFGRVTAMETHDNAYAYACARNIGTIYPGQLPGGIPDEIHGDFDLIVMLDVLEHVEEDDKTLAVLHEYAKGQGKLLITVPAFQWLWSRHDEIHHHHRRYTAGRLRQLLENNGWRVSYISYFNALLFPLALAARLLEKLMPSKKETALGVPPGWLNTLLSKIFGLERYFVGSVSLPFGLSLIAVAEKNGTAGRAG